MADPTDALPMLPSGPVGSIPEAIHRMESIAAALPETDGVACFNRMYLTVTREVGARMETGFFADPVFMDRLDVVFANLYLAALDGWAADATSVCRSWRALISRHTRTDVAPLQFAVAGMNAHINHDLPLALVATCREAGTELGAGSHHDDFQEVNALLALLQPGHPPVVRDGGHRRSRSSLSRAGERRRQLLRHRRPRSCLGQRRNPVAPR